MIDYATVISYVITQYSMNHGLKELGEKGETAVMEDMYLSFTLGITFVTNWTNIRPRNRIRMHYNPQKAALTG